MVVVVAVMVEGSDGGSGVVIEEVMVEVVMELK